MATCTHTPRVTKLVETQAEKYDVSLTRNEIEVIITALGICTGFDSIDLYTSLLNAVREATGEHDPRQYRAAIHSSYVTILKR
jgi:hypothetical protein